MRDIVRDEYRKIDEQIKNNSLRQMYLLYGQEAYLKKQYRDRLIKALSTEGDTMNTSFFAGKDIPVGEVIDLAETMPFFAERRLIVVEESGFFKNACEDLAAYLEEPAASAVFLFVENEVDKRSKMFKAVVKNGETVDFARQTEATLYAWVRSRLKGVGKGMQQSVFRLFLEKTGDDMERMDKEIEKLICYAWDREEITAQDVNAMCAQQITDQIFEMVRAIGEKKQRKALDLYYDLLALKNTPFQILYMINRQFSILLQIKELAAKGMPVNTIAERTGMREFAVKQNMAQTRQFTKEQIRQAIEDGIQTEQDAKSGRLDAQLGVELLIVKYSGAESEI